MHSRASESGNMMFYLMIAVVLLAALAFAVSQGGRGGVEPLNAERVRLAAADIMAYADTMEKAVAQVRLRGTDISALRFAHNNLPAADYGTFGAAPFDEVFNPQGGAVLYAPPPTTVIIDGTAEQYQFLANNEIVNVGTTCGAASCSDLLMVIDRLRRDVCLQINQMVGVAEVSGDAPVDTDLNETAKFQGTFGFTRTIGDDAGGEPLQGKTEGCFQETGEEHYVYYKILVAR